MIQCSYTGYYEYGVNCHLWYEIIHAGMFFNSWDRTIYDAIGQDTLDISGTGTSQYEAFE